MSDAWRSGWIIGVLAAALMACSEGGGTPFGSAGVQERIGEAQGAAMWALTQKLEAPMPKLSDRFGNALAVSGDEMIVGAPNVDTDKGALAGAAFIYVREGSQWKLDATLIPSSLSDNTFVGSSVAIEGDIAIVGSRNGVTVFRRINGTWTEADSFSPSGVTNEATLASSGDRFIISGSHQVHVYVFDGSHLQFEADLVDVHNINNFGSRVSISGDTAVVSGLQGDGFTFFSRTGSGWTEQQYFSGSLGFCNALSIDGSNAIIAGYDDVSASDTVSLYVFNGTAWSKQGSIVPDEAAKGFGYDVAVLGSSILIGANPAVLFERSGTGAITQIAELAPDADTGLDYFGWFVALGGNVAILGVPISGFGAKPGRVYLFAAPSTVADAGVDASAAATEEHSFYSCAASSARHSTVSGNVFMSVPALIALFALAGARRRAGVLRLSSRARRPPS